MSKIVLVVAPHPDDETLGCGGTLLKHVAEGDSLHWLIMTQMSSISGYSAQQMLTRQAEIDQVAKMYGVSEVHQLPFSPAKLDELSMSDIVTELYPHIQKIQPQVIYLPYRGDAHNDHQITFDAIAACSKSFRAPFVERILAYETLSETDFSINPDTSFRPNVWFDIYEHVAKKLAIMKVYKSELSDFPFPRSIETIESLAKVRGAQCASFSAEAFMLLKEINK